MEENSEYVIQTKGFLLLPLDNAIHSCIGRYHTLGEEDKGTSCTNGPIPEKVIVFR